jgi:hypothetical protein
MRRTSHSANGKMSAWTLLARRTSATSPKGSEWTFESAPGAGARKGVVTIRAIRQTLLVHAQVRYVLPKKGDAPLEVDDTSCIWGDDFMKNTSEIPDPIFPPDSVAAEQGVRLCEFLTEAVRAKLAVTAKASDKPWMNLRGRLKHLHEETKHISRLIDENSARIDPEVWSRSQTHATGQRYGSRSCRTGPGPQCSGFTVSADRLGWMPGWDCAAAISNRLQELASIVDSGGGGPRR